MGGAGSVAQCALQNADLATAAADGLFSSVMPMVMNYGLFMKAALSFIATMVI